MQAEHLNLENLLPILRCPKCKGKLTVQREDPLGITGLDCSHCRLRFNVDQGLANFLLDEAETI